MPKAPWIALAITAICGGQTQFSGSGVVAGSIKTPAGNPVGGASVILTRQDSPSQSYTLETGARGEFVFPGMTPGTYKLCSFKRTYFEACYEDDSGDEFVLSAGQTFDPGVRLEPQAIVSGRVIDENGDQVPRVRVQALDENHKSTGGPGGLTDAEGNFALGDLRTGTFYLQVEAQQSGLNSIHSPGHTVYATTFYPGVTDLAKATAIHVESGKALRDLEIRVKTARAYRVEGRVVTAASAQTSSPILRLLPAGVIAQARNGDFAFDNILPGSYVLESQDTKSGRARIEVTVSDSDVSGLVLSLAPDLPVPSEPVSTREKVSIRGSVLSAGGQPLRNAVVIAGVWEDQPKGSQGLPLRAYSGMSDAQGNFVFEGLDDANYGVCADRPGYLHSCWFSNSRSTGVAAAGQSVNHIDIKLTPQAVISGKITDEFGDPLPNTQVSIARLGISGGHKTLEGAGGQAITNAEGSFAMGSSQPGKYFVMVTPPSPGAWVAAPAPMRVGEQRVSIVTYYPGVTETSAAVPFEVAEGATIRGINIRVKQVRAFRIQGRLEGFTPDTEFGVQIASPTAGSYKHPTTNAKTGEFEFDGLTPGDYTLNASQGREGGLARRTISIANADVDHFVLKLAPGADIAGTVTFTGTKPEPPPYVGLSPTSGPATGSGGQTAADGSFVVQHLPPAKYRVGVSAANVFIKSAQFDGRDVTGHAIDLTSSPGGTLNLVLAPNSSSVVGIARDANGKPLPNIKVTLWKPGLPDEGSFDFSLIRETDANGAFKFANLPPGEYRVAAWEERFDLDILEAPPFRSIFDSQAATVKLSENQQAQVDSPVIGRTAIEAAIAGLP